jgi:hypothetical protein
MLFAGILGKPMGWLSILRQSQIILSATADAREKGAFRFVDSGRKNHPAIYAARRS